MARIIKGLLSGTFAGMIFCAGKKRTFVRNPSRNVLPPPSAAQLLVREKLRLTNQTLLPLRSLIDETWESRKYTKKTAFGSAFASMMINGFDRFSSGVEIDYQNIRICRGTLNQAPGLRLDLNGTRLTVSWINRGFHARNTFFCRDEDEAILVLLFPKSKVCLICRNGEIRRDEQLKADLPSPLVGQQMHAWFFFTNQGSKRSSNSEYLGEIAVGF